MVNVTQHSMLDMTLNDL